MKDRIKIKQNNKMNTYRIGLMKQLKKMINYC